MATLLQINTVINSGSTGHIAEEIGKTVMRNGWVSYIAYGRNPRETNSKSIKICSNIEIYRHVFITRLLDWHGFGSYFGTKKLIKKIKEIKPDIIHLHNIHGYYLNIRLLFDFLKKTDIPVIWTLHDCWAFTGHCSHYTAVHCEKWKKQCFGCSQIKYYPKSYFDNSYNNYLAKKRSFTGHKNLTIVTPSKWLSEQVAKSFLNEYPIKVIENGIDTEIFNQRKGELKLFSQKKIILGVASSWGERKGLYDFIDLSRLLDISKYQIVLIGLRKSQIKKLPKEIYGIERTENAVELAQWYSSALVYFNPSIEETQGLTTVEALACGTPCIVYNTTAVPEAVSEKTGFVVDKGNLTSVVKCIFQIEKNGKAMYSAECRERAATLFNKKEKFQEYFELYKEIL